MTEPSLTLSEEQLDHLADLLAVRLTAAKPPTRPMLTVEDVSATFQVSRAWVYENAGRLGGVKLGPGRRAPLRFDESRVTAALNPLARQEGTASAGRPTPVRRIRPSRLHPVYDG
jgi:hypothetical protein